MAAAEGKGCMPAPTSIPPGPFLRRSPAQVPVPGREPSHRLSGGSNFPASTRTCDYGPSCSPSWSPSRSHSGGVDQQTTQKAGEGRRIMMIPATQELCRGLRVRGARAAWGDQWRHAALSVVRVDSMASSESSTGAVPSESLALGCCGHGLRIRNFFLAQPTNASLRDKSDFKS